MWKVRVWTGAGTPSAWSDTASFETGIGGTAAWTAAWISWDPAAVPFEPATEPGPVDQVALGLTPAPYLRRDFDVPPGLACARLYITARGLYEAHLNGARVGDRVLSPGWTDYALRLQYQAYDVTDRIVIGANTLGALLGDGWYCGYFGSHPKRSGAHYGQYPDLLAELHLRYADGHTDRVVTDASWTANWGDILHADPLMGELQCSGLHPVGWDRPPFDDHRWHPVRARQRDAVAIVADPGAPIRITQELVPTRVTTTDGGTTLIDVGQNITGWLRITVEGQGGDAVRIRHGEVLDTDGRLYVDNLRTARQTDEYWTSGGRETFEPHFTWHGFRYAEVTGSSHPLVSADITACVVHADLEATGTFACSDQRINRLHTNIDWSLRDNFLSVPTDCPQRDERLGWLGDAQVFAPTATYLRDVLAFFDKWLDDVLDAQAPSGAFPDVAPRLGLAWSGAPGWGDAGVIVPWTLYKMYGALGPATRCYHAMTAWMDHLSAGNSGNLRTRDLGNDYGDWLAPGGDATPHELLATAYWALDAALMGQMANALGRVGDAAAYRRLADDIAGAFATEFVDGDGRIAGDTQTGYALALNFDLVPTDRRTRTAKHLADAVTHHGSHLSTGFVGVGHLLPALSENGHSDVAYTLLGQDTLPSWLYPVLHGATTMWERWDAWTEDQGFQSPHMNSFNHYAFGAVGEWLYRFMAGIDQPQDSVGFERVLLRPHPGGPIGWARATFRSARGPIRSAWRRYGGTLVLDASVPPGVTARVCLPSTDPDAVVDRHGSGPDSVGVFGGAPELGEAVFEVGPGTHRFTGSYPGVASALVEPDGGETVGS
jgi:alpha-L-rhamnosidase